MYKTGSNTDGLPNLLRLGVIAMTMYETLSIMIAFSMFTIALTSLILTIIALFFKRK